MTNLTPKKILIVGPSWVGDMVMAQTLFIHLKNQYPDCQLDVIAPDWTRPLLARMPEITEALSLPMGHGQLHLKQRYGIGKSLRDKHYDQAILLPNSFKSAIIPWAANIPKRTGWRGEMRYGVLNDIRILDKNVLPLMIERFIALGQAKNTTLPNPLPRPKLDINPDSVNEALNTFELTSEKPILALCPGAEYGPAKRWPTEYFANVAKQKASEGMQVWIFGSHKDKEFSDEIQAKSGNVCVDLCGKTNLAQAIDLMSLAKWVLTNDSGLMHIAAALNRPIIALYGSSSPKFTPPLGDHIQIATLNLSCSPCFERTCPLNHLNCLKQLTPDKILALMA